MSLFAVHASDMGHTIILVRGSDRATTLTVLACRPQRKKVHWIAHSLAAVCAVLGLTAAWRSHTLKASARGAPQPLCQLPEVFRVQHRRCELLWSRAHTTGLPICGFDDLPCRTLPSPTCTAHTASWALLPCCWDWRR